MYFKLGFKDFEQMRIKDKHQHIDQIKEFLRSIDGLSVIYSEYNNSFLRTSAKKIESFDTELTEVKEETKKEYTQVQDTIFSEGEFYRLIHIEEYPKDRDINFNSLQYMGDFFVAFRKQEFNRSKKQVELIRRTNFSGIHQDIRNIESERGLDESEGLLEGIIYGHEDIFEFETYFYIKNKNFENLNIQTLNLRDFLHSYGFKTSIENLSLKYSFSLYLGKERRLRKSTKAHSSYLANLVPSTNDYFFKEGYKFKSVMDSDIRFSIFNESSNSYGMTISGATGLGKSLLGNKIILEEVNLGASAVILDRNGSYRKLCNYLDGVELAKKFNPLIFKDPLYLTSFITSVVPDDFLSELERAKLFNFLKEADLESINTVEDLISLINTRFLNIKPFFSELMDHFDDSTLDEYRLVYIDFCQYPKKILAPLLVFILRYFYQINGKKIILMDECHHLLKNNIDFVDTMFRELRKQKGAPIALTQSFNDFITSDIGKTIADNSFYKMFFHQSIKESEFLSREDIESINKVSTKKGEYSEFYVKTEFNSKIFRFEATPLEYELFTSDYNDNQLQAQIIPNLSDSGFSFKDSMDIYTRIKHG